MRETPLFQLTRTRYPVLKSQFPNEGRRKWLLRVVEEFWRNLDPSSEQQQQQQALTSHDRGSDAVKDTDPSDVITEGPELGILLRTDYSNEHAWQTFYSRLQDSEKEFAETVADDNMPEDPPVTNAAQADNNNNDDDDAEMNEGSEDDADEEDEVNILKVVNPISAQERDALTNISNLTALRLLNEVDIRLTPPRIGNRITPPNRLVDHGGWQEVYEGKCIWIYDVKSNTDQSVRVVSQQGDIYGTATADSWRAQVSHICELQVNICGGMKIDFGGLDRWDFEERKRNLDEANQSIV